MTKIIFLPGAGASAAFWRPVADLLDAKHSKRLLSWPGLGNEPRDANVRSADDLVSMVLKELQEPADLIAQSMGGLIAMRAALVAPDKVRRLVLVAASAGVAVEDLGGVDWRPDYYRAFPHAAKWLMDVKEDLSPLMPGLSAPTLLIFGDADPISPVAVGERLRDLLPNAQLHIVRGGDHDLAVTHAAQVAALIANHLDRG
jgi:pimeloyl-ACP methyl ester carboxylesterase